MAFFGSGLATSLDVIDDVRAILRGVGDSTVYEKTLEQLPQFGERVHLEPLYSTPTPLTNPPSGCGRAIRREVVCPASH